MPKTRASFRIAEDAQPLGKRPRRSCKTSGVLKELENVPKSRRSRELKKEPRVKCKEPENAPRSGSKRTTSEDEAPKRRKLPKRKGRGVPPLRLQEEIMGDDEEDEEDDNVAPSNVKKAPRRRSSARIQKQITDKPTEPEKYDRPDDKDKNRPKSQANRRNDSKRKKLGEVGKLDGETKTNNITERADKKKSLDRVVETLKKKRELADYNASQQKKVKAEPEPGESVGDKPESEQWVKHEVSLEPKNDPSIKEEYSPAIPNVHQARSLPRPPIKVRFVDDEELSDTKSFMIDFIAPSKARVPITVVQDEEVYPIIDLTDKVKEHLLEGSTTLEEVHRAFMGLEVEKAAFQPSMPERPQIIDDIDAADREQEEKMRELRRNLKAEAPDCDCGRRGRSE